MKKRLIYLSTIFIVTLLALTLRLHAVEALPIDYDEDDYLAVAQRYAQAIQKGDVNFIINYDFNYEHPPLTKLVYGLVISLAKSAPLVPEQTSPNIPPARTLPEPHFTLARLTAAALGTLEVLALALLNPLAAFFLAIHSWQVKYTSQIMLEPLPSLTSALMVLSYVKAGNRRQWKGWLGLSAIMLGLTAASKYTYCVAAFAIIVDWLWAEISLKTTAQKEGQRVGWRDWLNIGGQIIWWGLISIFVFVAFNPRLWHDPFQRLQASVLFHGDYAQSEHVRRAGFPMWQPLIWLMGSAMFQYQFFYFLVDPFITVLAIYGIRPLWRKQRVFVLWLFMALGFLFLWPTKWPQYILILTVPLSLAAAEGFRVTIWRAWQVYAPFKKKGGLMVTILQSYF